MESFRGFGGCGLNDKVEWSGPHQGALEALKLGVGFSSLRLEVGHAGVVRL